MWISDLSPLISLCVGVCVCVCGVCVYIYYHGFCLFFFLIYFFFLVCGVYLVSLCGISSPLSPFALLYKFNNLH